MAGIRRQEVKNFMIIPRVDQHLLIGRCISTWSCIANAVSGRAERLKCWIKRSFTFFRLSLLVFGLNVNCVPFITQLRADMFLFSKGVTPLN